MAYRFSRLPFNYPTRSVVSRQLPQHDVEGRDYEWTLASSGRWRCSSSCTPTTAELRHHGDARHRFQHADPYSSAAGAGRGCTTAARWRERGRRPDARRDRFDRARSGIRGVVKAAGRLMGFGHRCTRTRPRARIIKQAAYDVFEVTARIVARHRPGARGDGALGSVLHRPQAVSERRLLLRPDLPGHGVPRRDVTVLFAIPRMSAGWPPGRSCSTTRPRRSPARASVRRPDERSYVPARPTADICDWV